MSKYLFLKHSPTNSSLNNVRSIQTVKTICPDNSSLLFENFSTIAVLRIIPENTQNCLNMLFNEFLDFLIIIVFTFRMEIEEMIFDCFEIREFYLCFDIFSNNAFARLAIAH